MEKTDKTASLRHAVWAICIGVIITCAFSAYADKTEDSLADGLIRLHVIANSDAESDQNLKLAVRDAIVAETGELFADNRDKSAAREEILANMDNIERVARNVISEKGFDYDVSLSLGASDFPTKTYGNVTLPAGTYEALKVVIGDGAGKNWWCVLFPPLCFVDAATAEMPESSSELLKTSLTDDQYAMVTDGGKFPVKVKFKAYELWQNSKFMIKSMFVWK